MLVVYIASAYTNGDQAANVAAQIHAAHELMDLGCAPIAPLLSHFLHIVRQRPYEEWLAMDMALLLRADVVLALPRTVPSPGAVAEVIAAQRAGMPVLVGLQEFRAWLADFACNGSDPPVG